MTATSPATPRPLAPVEGAALPPTRPTFRWRAVPEATSYTLQVAPDAHFDQPLLDTTVEQATSYTLDQPLPPRSQTLYWRVRAQRPEGATAWSAPQSFVTSDDPDEVLNPVLEARTSAGSALLWVALVVVSFVLTIGLLAWASLSMS